MTVLDPTGEMDIHRSSGDHVVVRLPLAVRSETWMHEFTPLAHAKEFSAEVREFPGRDFSDS